ncbi:uncharacterized protein LOC115627372 [Scaptodrosophila lebanonensis]|uniref:Uncharacterized protein LOC115627372 n=1 Tax=Drosophila lebanonensis TaxID=7225 RepID=A0A6J2TS45_DROLE|nr:uncharacterized protein LOC115627372 [Scaptodrosophila lebanonensis]
MVQFYFIALALVSLANADVSHLGLPGGDSSSYQPEHLIPQHLRSQASGQVAAEGEVVPGGHESSYQPAELRTADVQSEVVPGGDASSYTPANLQSEVVPGGDASSYTPAHLQGQGRTVGTQVENSGESFNIGANTHTPEQFIPEADRQAHYAYVNGAGRSTVTQQYGQAGNSVAEVVPGSEEHSYQPQNLIPEQIQARTAAVENTQEVIPGSDSSSYQPANLVPTNLQRTVTQVQSSAVEQGAVDAALVAPVEAVSQVEGQQSGAFVAKSAQAVVPGSETHSYQPVDVNTDTPQQYQTSVVEQRNVNVALVAPVEAEGGVETQANTYTPRQYQTSGVQETTVDVALVAPTVAETVEAGDQTSALVAKSARVVVPGSEVHSYQPAELVPAYVQGRGLSTAHVASTRVAPVVTHQQHVSYSGRSFSGGQQTVPVAIGANTQTPEQFIPEADRIAHYNYQRSHVQQQSQTQVQVDVEPVVGYVEPRSNGIEEFNADTHVPIAIGRNTYTPAHLLGSQRATTYTATGVAAGARARSGYGTQYAPNGGYIY